MCGNFRREKEVISREFGIPCIIGVKSATNVLQDGMLVCMDADSAKISIINGISDGSTILS
jgi:phosphohistidine swiveling domain-containing protein